MSIKDKLKQDIDKAWDEFNVIAAEEEEDDYSDAMVSMDRTRAEGYAEGLQYAWELMYDETYEYEER
jgi:hypothetical protein